MIYDAGVDRTNFDSSGLSTGYDESLLMTDIEAEILSLIKGQFEGIKDVDVSTLGADWQSKMLQDAEGLKNRFISAFQAKQAEIMQNVRTSMTNGFIVGMQSSKRELTQAGVKYPDREYTLNDAKEGENTLLTAFSNVLQAEAMAIQSAVTAYVSTVGLITSATSGRADQLYDSVFVPQIEKGLTGKVTKSGAKLGLANYVEGVTRETSQQALLMGESTVANAAGQYLVRISRHASSCPKCEPYQGAILIDDVFSDGKPDGLHDLLSVAIANGLFHWNCRHKKTVWIPGKTQVPRDNLDYDPSKVAQNYAIEQRQRQLERQIRESKRIAATSLDPRRVAQAQIDQADLQEELNDLIQTARSKGYAVYRQPHKEAAGFTFDPQLPYGGGDNTTILYGKGNNSVDNGGGTQYNESVEDKPSTSLRKISQELQTRWDAMSEDERAEHIDGVCYFVIKDLKLKDAKQYTYNDNMQPNRRGSYNPETREIKINTIIKDDYVGLIYTLAHEYRHDWQYTVPPQNEYEEIVQKSAREYIEFTGKNYDQYSGQIAELDAKHYAEKFVEKFFGSSKGGQDNG